MNIIPITKGRIHGKIQFRFNDEMDWCNCDHQMLNGEVRSNLPTH